VNDSDCEELNRLRTQVQEVLDRQAITDCVYRYARGLDRHDEQIYSSAYHEDAIDHHGEFLGRRDEFVPWGLALLASDWDAHTHFISNVRIDIDGDIAHSECYVLFVQRRRDRPVVDLGGGRYIDRLERRSQEWRIAARELVIEWTAEAATTEFGGTESYPRGRWDRDDPSYRRPFELPEPEPAR
jgi:3-phenylpropionate/cinnamic acid dioxygenase small subunit